MTSLHTLSYAVPSSGYLWRWSGDFDAIEWYDGSTLALWQEVHTVLAFFEDRVGLPPFGALLFILAACREDWEQSLPAINQRVRKILSIDENNAIPEHIAKVLITGLDAIHALPADLRSSVAAKCHLVSLLLEGGPHSLSRDSSRHVLDDFSARGAKCLAGLGNERSDPKARLERDIRALELGLKRHTPTSLESLLRTGLETNDFQPAEIGEKVIEVADPRLLLDALVAAGGESGAAAMVAKRTIAMINFPGHVGTPRDLPVGGIADITNRGTIDRLLPGELAWDDLVLAARLVHNEALYFRREIPPMNVAIAHTVLLSRELRLWGIGRVLSLGIALGLWHHPALNGAGETFECVAATEADFEYLELDSPAKISAALETLVPSSGPIAFLRSWWDAAQIVDDPAVPDLTFITETSHLDDDDVRLLLGEIAGWIHGRGGHFRVIALDRHGNLEVQSWTPGGNRTLFRGEIDVEEILASSHKARPSEALIVVEPLRKEDGPYPLLTISPVYREEELPFLFPIHPKPDTTIPEMVPGYAFIGISTEGHLARWPKQEWGGQILSAKIPGRLHWVSRDGNDSIVIITSGQAPGESVRVHGWNEDEGFKEIPIEPSRHSFPRHAAVDGNVVMLAYSDLVEVFSINRGIRLHEQKLTSLPARPILHWTGDKVTVLDAGPQGAAHRQSAGGKVASSLPHMLKPDAVSLEGGVLMISCGKQRYKFHPIHCSWEGLSGSLHGFTPLTLTELQTPMGDALRTARLGSRLQVWHDPIGLLHIRDVTANDDSGSWSIMLSSSATSIWSRKYGLCSMDNRLNFPEGNAPVKVPRLALQSYLSDLSSATP